MALCWVPGLACGLAVHRVVAGERHAAAWSEGFARHDEAGRHLAALVFVAPHTLEDVFDDVRLELRGGGQDVLVGGMVFERGLQDSV